VFLEYRKVDVQIALADFEKPQSIAKEQEITRKKVS